MLQLTQEARYTYTAEAEKEFELPANTKTDGAKRILSDTSVTMTACSTTTQRSQKAFAAMSSMKYAGCTVWLS